MPILSLSRRSSLLLPVLLAACGDKPRRTDFPRFNYDFYTKFQLNVRTVDIETRFVPAKDKYDVAYLSPADPIAAVRQIGEDRVKALGNTNRAVFAVVDATLTQRGDVVRGALEATLELYSDANVSQGYVQARAERKHTGDVDDLRGTLYDMVATMKDDLNLELEHQIRSKMKSWLIEGVNATPEKVDSAPLTAPGRR